MTAENKDRPIKARTQPLGFLPINVAKLMLADGVVEIFTRNDLVGAMFKLAMLTWNEGPISEARAESKVGLEEVQALLEAGAISEDDGLISVPWVEAARTESDAMRVSKAEKARKAAQTRWEADASACNRMQPHASASQYATEREERKRDRDISSPSEKSPRKRGTPATNLWASLWSELRGMDWVWKQKDAVAMSRCMSSAGGDLSEVERRARRMLMSTNEWVATNASPCLLLSKWNEMGIEVVRLTATERAAIPTVESQDLLRGLQEAQRAMKEIQ